MSLYYDTVIFQDTDTCQTIETFQSVAAEPLREDDAPYLAPIRDEPRDTRDESCSKYLPSGAEIISSDERSKAVLCNHQGEWSVWLLDEEGEPIRGAYFKSMRAAAFDYAEHVMGCHPGEGAVEIGDVEE